jgi:hypothetical protein
VLPTSRVLLLGSGDNICDGRQCTDNWRSTNANAGKPAAAANSTKTGPIGLFWQPAARMPLVLFLIGLVDLCRLVQAWNKVRLSPTRRLPTIIYCN